MASVRVDKVQCLRRLNVFVDRHADEVGECGERYAYELTLFVKQADARLPVLYSAWKDMIREYPEDHQDWLVRAWEAAYDVREEDLPAVIGRIHRKDVDDVATRVVCVRGLSDGGNVVVRFGRTSGMYTRMGAVGELGERSIDGYVECLLGVNPHSSAAAPNKHEKPID